MGSSCQDEVMLQVLHIIFFYIFFLQDGEDDAEKVLTDEVYKDSSTFLKVRQFDRFRTRRVLTL